MNAFLQRFAHLVLGVLSGFDRLVFRGRLRPLYSPEGMHCYLDANHILRKDFTQHVKEVTKQVLHASLISQAKQQDRFQYLPSSAIDKDQIARQFAEQNHVQQGLVCVLQCVEPCWSFDLDKVNGLLVVRGKQRKCSHLYHYFIHPTFGWMYARLQTWFPFEMQVYVNGREWLTQQLQKAGLKYERQRNKILWAEDWPRTQQLLDEQLHTNWAQVLDQLREQVHPLHPHHLGQLPIGYTWTFHQSEWATDVVFTSRDELHSLYERWLHQAMLNFDSLDILRFLGHSRRLLQGDRRVETEYKPIMDDVRIRHWVGRHSLKMYDFANLLRVEMTLNDASVFTSYRTSESAPEGPKAWRRLRRGVADVHRRAEIGQKANERYLGALASVGETKTVQELAEPFCQRVAEPGAHPKRKVRALNPLAGEDATLLETVADPRWLVNGLRNRDLVKALYRKETTEAAEKRRRSARVTRLIRLLRGHGIVQKVAHSHRYHVRPEARTKILAILAARNANPDELTTKAA